MEGLKNCLGGDSSKLIWNFVHSLGVRPLGCVEANLKNWALWIVIARIYIYNVSLHMDLPIFWKYIRRWDFGFNLPPGQFSIKCFYLGLKLTVSSRRPQASQQKLEIFLHFFMYGVFQSVNFPKAFCEASQFRLSQFLFHVMKGWNLDLNNKFKTMSAVSGSNLVRLLYVWLA